MIYYIIIIKDTNDANLSWHYKRIRWQSFNKQNCPPPRPVEEKLFLSFFPWKEVQRWTINRVFCPGSENHSELLWNLQELISTCPKTKTWSIHNTQYTNTIHIKQYTIHIKQYTIHNIQYTIHNTQYTIHNTQYTIHNSISPCPKTNKKCPIHRKHNSKKIKVFGMGGAWKEVERCFRKAIITMQISSHKYKFPMRPNCMHLCRLEEEFQEWTFILRFIENALKLVWIHFHFKSVWFHSVDIV